MTRDSLVVVLNDPLMWGVGIIRDITGTGRLRVEFADSTRETFEAHELELFAKWQESACTLVVDVEQLKQAA